ncbi:MAG: sensor histidine kinase [Nocardioidaceae bacterium]
MRKRIVGVAVAAVVVAVLLFGIPLAIAIDNVVRSDEQGELERLALRGAVAVSPGYQARDPIELPATPSEVQLAVYDPAGRLIAGIGPPHVDMALGSVSGGVVVEYSTPDDVAVGIAVTAGERVIAVVRAASPRSTLQKRVWETWGLMAALALLGAGCASGLAIAASRRLIRPLTKLEAVAAELGEGNFAVRASPSGVAEIDRAGDALNKTGARLDDLVSRERTFSANVSHQLRTPLTSLRLELESAVGEDSEALRAAAAEAINSVDMLSRTVDEVLSLARSQSPSGEGFDVAQLLDDLRDRWHGVFAARDRPFRVVSGNSCPSQASLAAARQILDVLIDNAYQHGRGVVTVAARDSAGALAIDVIDDGSAPGLHPLDGPAAPVAPGHNHGKIGLRLACALATSQGGRVLQAHGEPRTRFTLLLPTRNPSDDVSHS